MDANSSLLYRILIVPFIHLLTPSNIVKNNDKKSTINSLTREQLLLLFIF